MYPLTTVFPVIRRLRRFPFTRDQAMLLLMAVNMLFLGIDTFVAHSMSGTIRPNERIPIIFGITAGVILLAAGVIAIRYRNIAVVTGATVYLIAIIVGVLGTYFHLRRALPSGGLIGQPIALSLLVWAPPTFGPLAFCLTGWIGISAVWPEEPIDSGILLFPGRRVLRFPYRKTQAYFFLVGLGVLMALLTSTIDHARTGFTNPWLIVPLAAGVFGTVVPIVVGLNDNPSRGDLLLYVTTMALLILVGLVGGLLHLQADLTSQSQIVFERFLRGAPFLAPFLFANFGLLGMIALLDPDPGAEKYKLNQ